MLSLEAKEWKKFEGGYRLPYDASIPLRLLEASKQPNPAIWDELFGNLYHQGDVGIASYAAIPQLYRIYKEKDWLDFNLPSLAAAVEETRTNNNNPEVPTWLSEEYHKALEMIAVYCIQKRNEQCDPNFRKALLLLIAVLVGARDSFELLEAVQIGDEKTALELYDKYA